MSVEYDHNVDVDELEEYFCELPVSVQRRLIKDVLNDDPVFRSMMMAYILDDTNTEGDIATVRTMFRL